MSDYLWDKSGEPDAEVERLEELLGRLRHAPRALELPSKTDEHAHARTSPNSRALIFRRTNLSRSASLAAAAALLLALLAGALVMLRPTPKQDGRAASNEAQTNTPPQQPVQDTPQHASKPEDAPKSDDTAKPGDVAKSDESAPRREAASQPPAQRRVRQREVASGGRARESFRAEDSSAWQKRAGVTAASASGGVNGGGASDLERRVRAKEQLVYAMRLTSDALREVRSRAAGVEGRGNAFDARTPQR